SRPRKIPCGSRPDLETGKAAVAGECRGAGNPSVRTIGPSGPTGVVVTACRHRGSCCNTGSPRSGKRDPNRTPARDRPGWLGRRGGADRLVVRRRRGSAGGGKGLEFKKGGHGGKGGGEWCKPVTSSFDGQDPKASSHLKSTGQTGESGAFLSESRMRETRLSG